MSKSAQATVGLGGREVARAAARLLAMNARSQLNSAESILATAGDKAAAKVAYDAGEATTRLIRETYDGDEQVFACRR